MRSTPRTPAPERPPPPVPPPLETPRPDQSPSPPGEEYHTPTPSLDASPREASPPAPEEYGSANDDGAANAKSPQLSPLHFSSLSSPTDNGGREGRAATAGRSRPQLRLATGLVRTPSQGSAAAKSPPPSPSPLTPAPAAKSPSPSPPSPVAPTPAAKPPSPSLPSPLTPAPAAKSPSPSPPSPVAPTPAAKSPSPSPPSPLTHAPAPAAKSPSPSPPSPLTPAPWPTVNSKKSAQSTPKRLEAWKPPPPPPLASPAAIAAQFDPVEEAATSPLRVGKPRIDQQRRTPAFANENRGAAAAGVPSDVAAVAKVGERRSLSVALRVATAVLSLAAFAVMVSARTTGWAGDYFGRHEQYRYAVGVNVIVCAYSIAQSICEIRRLISPRSIFRSKSSYYFSLLLDQALAYLLMSASSAAASRNDLWVTRFGTDPFNKKINSALWLSFIAFLTLAANALISTANLFHMV